MFEIAVRVNDDQKQQQTVTKTNISIIIWYINRI